MQYFFAIIFRLVEEDSIRYQAVFLGKVSGITVYIFHSAALLKNRVLLVKESTIGLKKFKDGKKRSRAHPILP
jgi:hypothetical protein